MITRSGYFRKSYRRCGKEAKSHMSTIRVGENETLDSALRRFKRKCARDGIIGDLRKKEHYEKPSVRQQEKGGGGEKTQLQRLKTKQILTFYT